MTLAVSVVSTARHLARPARNARAAWAQRASCIITLKSDTGTLGQGEAAPLPDFSPDRLADCEQALSELDPSGIPGRLEPNQDLIGELGRASVRIPPNLPAARAALEGALLDLWARAARVPAWALLSPHAPRSRAVAALLSGEPEQAVEQAVAARARGIETFKFKIGRPGALQRELSAVQALRAALGPLARLRLDANQALSAEEAREFLPKFATCDVEFIEEPCAPRELAQLTDLGLPLALDESLAAGARPRSGDRAVIAKPTLQGGVSGCFALAQAASGVGAELVLSHAFEGPLGLGLSAALALSIGSEVLAHGLDCEGAQLAQLRLPWYSEAALQAWSEPGFGIPEQP
ncbi:MAG TPA: o-succinylbenzoate synthase [Polyangiaceae bacterium]|nr:o-succinylbenzoate synthase [Polyangiaceae bacterium]